MSAKRASKMRIVFVAYFLAFLCGSANTWAQNDDAVIQLDETVISGNQELPKVLYILPWQRADGLPDIEVRHDFTESDVFRKLYPPAYQRELQYFDTLTSGKAHSNPSEE